MSQQEKVELLTVRDVANQLRVDQTTVRRWILQGALAAIELPHKGNYTIYRIRRSTLDALLNPMISSSPPTF